MVHIPLVSTAALIPLLGYPLLYLPIHIVVLELLIHPAAILGFQQSALDGITGQAQARKGFFGRTETAVILVTGTLITIAIAGLFITVVAGGEPPEHARTMAVTALVFSQVTVLAALTGLRGAAPRLIMIAALAFTFVATSIPVLTHWLDLHPLTLRDWLISAAAGFVAAAPSQLFHAAKPALRRRN